MDTIRLNHPHEILALFPYLFGFTPKDSIVLVALKGSHGIPGGPVARVDAPTVQAGLIDLALEFIDTLCVQDLYIGWYGANLRDMLDDRESVDILDTVGLASQHFVAMRTGGTGMVNVGLTDYESWVTCIDARAGVWEELAGADLVRPFGELQAAPAVAQAVFDGVAPVGNQPLRSRERLAWSERREAVMASRAWRANKRRGLRLWQEVLDQLAAGADYVSAVGTEEKAGQLNAALRDVLLRDQLILFGVDEGTVKIGGISARQLTKNLAAVGEPSPTRIALMIALFEYLAERSDDDDATPSAIAGYLAWWQGDTERAMSNAAQAMNSDHHYPLAKLVLHALHVNLPSPKDIASQPSRECEPSWNTAE